MGSAVTVADATKAKIYMKNFGEFYNNQIEYASTVILSRTKNMKEEKLQACVKLLQEKNEKANIITTDWDELTGEQILSAMEKTNMLEDLILKEEDICPVCGHHHDHDEHHHHDHEEHEHHHHDHEEHEHHHHDHEEHEHHHDHEEHEHHHHDHEEHEHHHHDHEEHGHHHHDHDEHGHHHEHDHDHHGHHHHHADDVFTSWGKETPRKYSEEELRAILEKLANSEEYGTILRSKGILPAADGTWFHFDLVPEEYEIRRGEADYTGRLCVIGTDLKEEKLQELFLL